MDMDVHVMIVDNDEWLTVKFTPDLETNCTVQCSRFICGSRAFLRQVFCLCGGRGGGNGCDTFYLSTI